MAGIDFSFIGGSMGGAVGESITRAAELALKTRTPLLVISASGGARMQEGCVSLMQMVKTCQAVARLAEEGVLYISLFTDPTYGGVSASYATLGDILMARTAGHSDENHSGHHQVHPYEQRHATSSSPGTSCTGSWQ